MLPIYPNNAGAIVYNLRTATLDERTHAYELEAIEISLANLKTFPFLSFTIVSQ